MEIRHDGKYTEINIGEMGLEIDDIFHEYITKETGITMSHDKIYYFIGKFIQEHNKEELRKEAECNKIFNDFKKWSKESNDDKPKSKFLRLWK